MTAYRFRIDRIDDPYPGPNPYTYAFSVSGEALREAFGTGDIDYFADMEIASARFAELCDEMLKQVWARIGPVTWEVNGQPYAQGQTTS